jgi:hypothetical protein
VTHCAAASPPLQLWRVVPAGSEEPDAIPHPGDCSSMDAEALLIQVRARARRLRRLGMGVAALGVGAGMGPDSPPPPPPSQVDPAVQVRRVMLGGRPLSFSAVPEGAAGSWLAVQLDMGAQVGPGGGQGWCGGSGAARHASSRLARCLCTRQPARGPRCACPYAQGRCKAAGTDGRPSPLTPPTTTTTTTTTPTSTHPPQELGYDSPLDLAVTVRGDRRSMCPASEEFRCGAGAAGQLRRAAGFGARDSYAESRQRGSASAAAA